MRACAGTLTAALPGPHRLRRSQIQPMALPLERRGRQDQLPPRIVPVEAGEIDVPVLIAAGTKDDVAGDPHELRRFVQACTHGGYSWPRPQSRGRRHSL